MADLAFLWHMHQPDYRHPDSGEFLLPWVLLHAIKDYTDMAAHLEGHPGIRCTINFVPVLLDQLEDYSAQFKNGQWRDPLLRIASWPDLDTLAAEDRSWLLDMAFRCHAPTMLEPFAPYRRLRDMLAYVESQHGNGLNYLSGAFFADLATWYLLAWSGESLRRLAVCESSDGFWWLGDDNSPQPVACFDRLFRENVKALYRRLKVPPPASLDHPISKGAGKPESGGTMRRAT